MTDNYERIREKEKRAQETSNVDTAAEDDTEVGRVKCRTK